jgi:2-iminobutanoate/2-iminopropanoate deaminase
LKKRCVNHCLKTGDSYEERNYSRRTVVNVFGKLEGYVSGFPPFDLKTGKSLEHASIESQTEVVLEQMKLCLDTAGSSLEHVLKCNVYCTSVEKFAAVNAVYTRYFPGVPPARIFICVVAWPGPFDIEIDCVATVKE